MSDFYLKIKKFNNEIEFSTDNEEIFDKKVKELLNDFYEIKVSGNVEENFETPASETQINDANLSDLCDFIDIEKPSESVNEIQNNQPKEQLFVDFEQILNNAQQNETIQFREPENTNDEFLTFIISQNPQNELDYLIFSAQYFQKYLSQQSFTLKQINSKLVPTKNIAITHKTLKDAIEQGFLELIPDLTNTSVSKEYALTQRGEYDYNK
ncbi:hypothetical protein J6Q66_02860 [bacterium]|nr:hypothetical protein [bacterium]